MSNQKKVRAYPSEISFRFQDSSIPIPQLWLRIKDRNEILIGLHEKDDIHYHLGFRYKGDNNSAVSAFVVETDTSTPDKEHRTVFETMPICSDEIMSFFKLIIRNVSSFVSTYESLQDAIEIIPAERLEEFDRFVFPGRGLKESMEGVEVAKKVVLSEKSIVEFLNDKYRVDNSSYGILDGPQGEELKACAIWMFPELAQILNQIYHTGIPEEEMTGLSPEDVKILERLERYIQLNWKPETCFKNYAFIDFTKLSAIANDFLRLVLLGSAEAFADKSIKDFLEDICQFIEDYLAGREVSISRLFAIAKSVARIEADLERDFSQEAPGGK